MDNQQTVMAGSKTKPGVAGALQSGLFISTVFLSAFLLFWSQPLFARMVLPLLGGASSVWTTSMLFFQFALLLGYVYVHVGSRVFTLRLQIVIHLLLVAAACMVLPFYLDAGRYPSHQEAPAFWVLSFAAQTIGLPFVAVSATAPLLQRWFSLTRHRHRHNPYFLYAASNLGSLAALFIFPMVLEPTLGVRMQTSWWQGGYYLLVVLLLAISLITWKGTESPSRSSPVHAVLPTSCRRKVSGRSRLLWVFLTFIPSSMMLGLTSHVTTDIGPVALFWVVPLALYLLSFVLVFSRCQRLVSGRGMAAIVVCGTLAAAAMWYSGYEKKTMTVMVAVAVHLGLFFAGALLLHGYLSRSKPEAPHLTEFYLWMSVGGMLGGLFNALIAPLIFTQVFEYLIVVAVVFCIAIKVLVGKTNPDNLLNGREVFALAAVFVLLLCAFLLVDVLMRRPVTPGIRQTFLVVSLGLTTIAALVAWRRRSPAVLLVVFMVACLGLFGNFLVHKKPHANLLLTRSFYGALRVKQKEDASGVPYHLFIHGSTRHNMQRFGEDAEENYQPLMYFHRQANLGHAVRSIKDQRGRPLHMGFVGLGAGAMSAYVDANDTAVYYEIDPRVVEMAQNPELFTYLSGARGGIKVILGDARLQLEKAADSSFDILLIDAFASDAIPVHLLTVEAVNLYLRKLQKDGLLLFHLSNRYLDLHRVLQGLMLPDDYALYYASKAGVTRPVEPGTTITGVFSHSQVAILARESILPEEITTTPRWRRLEHDPEIPPWTDDYSNIFRVARFLKPDPGR